MPNPTEDQDDSQFEWFDPFPEPHTIPSGWDLSELLSDVQPAPVLECRSEPMSKATERRRAAPTTDTSIPGKSVQPQY